MRSHYSIIIFIGLSSFYCAAAQADCSVRADTLQEVDIVKSHFPVVDSSGKDYSGCLLATADEVIGYSPEQNLCLLQGKITVRLSYSCCDTGPDQGDLACVVRAKDEEGEIPGNGVSVFLAK